MEAKIVVGSSLGPSWNRLWTGNAPRTAPDLILDAFLINFDRFLHDFGCFWDDFFKIFALKKSQNTEIDRKVDEKTSTFHENNYKMPAGIAKREE